MKFALVCGKRTEATKGARAVCPNPNCNAELIAKCGQFRPNHWAHKSKRNCDQWWEPETDWHRSWKNKYPVEWQEKFLSDDVTHEIHVADIRTIHGLVIEFQHSHIDPAERTTREKFYKNMVWLVDGTRLKRDYSRFLTGKNRFRRTNKKGFFIIDDPEECFPASWLGSLRPVIFDFRGTDPNEGINDSSNYLYCLSPKQDLRERLVVVFTRDMFVANTINGKFFKERQEPENQNNHPGQQIQSKQQLINTNRIIIRPRVSPYVFERGRWRKRYPRL
jgi:competence protein CoiA